ncbi:TIR domain-containing protein [Pseudonocardia sp. Ae717_Ps2]|uniref:TIR domain-containing protein n=1 Tax=Pseudonocardia sp. Ae717_Ps2 TaxID=1885573 RepID=UPI00094B35A3|nr:TIR domain-containing protein [Pseudonocardia sp. Ae717_Ps2]
MTGKVFVSHASVDAKLAQLFVDTLVLGGISHDQVFYSSQRGTGISPGADVRGSLRENLSSSSVVVALISEAFLSSPYCLMELGGAWVTEKPTCPVIVPPLGQNEVVRKIGNIQYLTLGDSEDVDKLFADLSDQIREHASISVKMSNLTRAVGDFKAKYSEIISDLSGYGRVQPLNAGSRTGGEVAEEVSSDEAKAPIAPGGTAIEAELYGVSAGNLSIEQTQYNTEVFGEATNNNSAHKTAILTATFYGNSGKIVGRANGIASDIGPGQTNSFTLTSVKPITDYVRYSLQFDSIF